MPHKLLLLSNSASTSHSQYNVDGATITALVISRRVTVLREELRSVAAIR